MIDGSLLWKPGLWQLFCVVHAETSISVVNRSKTECVYQYDDGRLDGARRLLFQRDSEYWYGLIEVWRIIITLRTGKFISFEMFVE